MAVLPSSKTPSEYGVMHVTYLHKRRLFMLMVISTASIIYVYDSSYSRDDSDDIGSSIRMVSSKIIIQRAIQTQDSGFSVNKSVNSNSDFRTWKKGNHGDVPIILFYEQHPFYWFSPFDLKEECPVNCLFTNNSKLYSESEAVIFFRSLRKPPPTKLRHQKWVFFTNESPAHIGPITTNKAWRPAVKQLDWILSYRPQADFVFHFGKLIRDKISNLNYSTIFSRKTKEVAWLVSHCETHSLRERYVKELQKYISVDIYGKCGTRNCSSVVKKEDDLTDCKSMFNTEYKFYLSFENSLCDNYVTEKVYGIYNRDNMVVPVVRGAPNISAYLPPGTYISTSDFKSPRKLAEYLKEVGSSEERFTSILKEKHKFTQIPWMTNYRQAICDLCKKLHSPNKDREKVGNVYRRLIVDKCYTPRDIVP